MFSMIVQKHLYLPEQFLVVYWTSRFCDKCQNEKQTTIVDLKDDEKFQFRGS